MKILPTTIQGLAIWIVVIAALVALMFADSYLYGGNKRKLFPAATTPEL